jgi:hypothetical protein
MGISAAADSAAKKLESKGASYFRLHIAAP